MNRIDYEAFTAELQENLVADDRIIGLVALGSMADRDYGPDEWSDHDFFVITEAGAQERFRQRSSWLPLADRIVLHFRETAHGVKAIYDFGHLVEFAVFDLDELRLARVNRYRVLFDRGAVGERMEEVEKSTSEREPPTDDYLFGQFVTNLVVGIGRHSRGEKLSGATLVKSDAVGHLLALIARHLPADSRLDNLDSRRRFELAHPEIAEALYEATTAQTLEAATTLLDVAEQSLAPVRSEHIRALAVLRQLIQRKTSASLPDCQGRRV